MKVIERDIDRIVQGESEREKEEREVKIMKDKNDEKKIQKNVLLTLEFLVVLTL